MTMTPDDKKRFNDMEKNLAIIMKAQSENSDKLDEVLDALKGNNLGDKGLVQRIKDLEEIVAILKSDKTKSGVYMRIITWLAGIIAVLIIGYMFNAAFNKPAQVNNNNPAPQQTTTSK